MTHQGDLDPDCPFCRWIRKGKATETLDTVAAFNDGYPVTKGHLLILPLRHTVDGFSMTAEEIRDSEALIRILCKEIKKNDFSVSGFNIGMNIGESAGQTVFHAHIHLIPRRGGDCVNPKGGVRGVIDGKRIYVSSNGIITMKIIPLEMTEDGWKTAEEEVEHSLGFSKGVYIHLAPFKYNGKDVFIPLRVGQAKGKKGFLGRWFLDSGCHKQAFMADRIGDTKLIKAYPNYSTFFSHIAEFCGDQPSKLVLIELQEEEIESKEPNLIRKLYPVFETAYKNKIGYHKQDISIKIRSWVQEHSDLVEIQDGDIDKWLRSIISISNNVKRQNRQQRPDFNIVRTKSSREIGSLSLIDMLKSLGCTIEYSKPNRINSYYETPAKRFRVVIDFNPKTGNGYIKFYNNNISQKHIEMLGKRYGNGAYSIKNVPVPQLEQILKNYLEVL